VTPIKKSALNNAALHQKIIGRLFGLPWGRRACNDINGPFGILERRPHQVTLSFLRFSDWYMRMA
jgi:hypothetical protein